MATTTAPSTIRARVFGLRQNGGPGGAGAPVEEPGGGPAGGGAAGGVGRSDRGCAGWFVQGPGAAGRAARMIIHSQVPVVRLSMVIPALNEVEALPGTLQSLARQGADPPFEVILADGGSRDGTVSAFREGTRDWPHSRGSARVVACPIQGRGEQMNAGAREAAGDVLLFLHADTHLPKGATRAVLGALDDPAVVGGGFRHAFADAGLLLRVISLHATARSLMRRIHCGDQALFARRSIFEALGGFSGEPLFEDLRFSRRLRSTGRIVTLPLSVSTSARRLRQGGVARTAARFAWLRLRHALGTDPARLKARYPDVR